MRVRDEDFSSITLIQQGLLRIYDIILQIGGKTRRRFLNIKTV